MKDLNTFMAGMNTVFGLQAFIGGDIAVGMLHFTVVLFLFAARLASK